MTGPDWLPIAALAAGVVAMLIAVAIVWRGRGSTRASVDDGSSLLLLQQQLDALRGQLGQALAGQSQAVTHHLDQLTSQMNDRLRETGDLMQRSQTSVGERLDNATRVVGEVQRGLGELREATTKVFEVGKSVSELHDILRAPKLRGGLGEFLLGDLLSQVLPSEHVTMQHGFRSGERVDAVVKLGGRLVPIDAKFPLEDFRRMLTATDDDARAKARKAFTTRVRKHIDDVASKYVLPDEDTYDFALMYVPAENVFYEAIVREEGQELLAYALSQKVVLASPNTLYAFLQAIVLGLRGLRIEARAEEVLHQLARLAGDVGRLRDDMRLVGKHLGNAQQAFASTERRLDRFAERLGSATGDERVEAVETRPVAQLPLRVPGA